MPCVSSFRCRSARLAAIASLGAFIAAAAPCTARAQSGTIMATATVLPRPLSIRDVARSAVPGELHIRIEGCARGAVTVDARNATTTTRTARYVIESGGPCGLRTLTVHLSAPVGGVVEYLVSLEQLEAVNSPSFSQFVVSARDVGRSALGY
jgi:hypothetical protein